MASKLSLEINSDNITPFTKKTLPKVFYNVCRIKKKIIFEHYFRIHMNGPKIAVCETTSLSVFAINTSFTRKDTYFHLALAKACDALNATMLSFGFTPNLEPYNLTQHQVQPPKKHPFYG